MSINEIVYLLGQVLRCKRPCSRPVQSLCLITDAVLLPRGDVTTSVARTEYESRLEAAINEQIK